MNKFFINKKESIAIALAGLASVLLVSGIVYSSTIGTDISTGGTFTVSGASTLSGAATLSSTLGVTGLSTLAGFISTASSSVAANFNVAGPISASSTLVVNGLSTLGGFLSSASSTVNGNLTVSGTFSPTLTSLAGLILTASSSVAANLSIAGPFSASSTLTVNGLSTLAGGYVSQASSTVTGTLHVGGGSDIAAMVFGMCFLENTTIAASTTGYADCSSATGVLSGDRVFVQATSSLAQRFQIHSASTTVNGKINVQIYNHGLPAASPINNLVATGSLNFWAVR